MERVGDIIERLKDSQPPKSLSEASVDPSIECDLCNDAGSVHPLLYSGKPDYSRVVPCLCALVKWEESREERYLEHCELPANSEHMILSNYKVQEETSREALEVAEELAEGTGANWLTLIGGVDRGKTHLLIAICRRWLELGKVARYAYVPLLLDSLRKTFDDGIPRSFDAQMDLYLNVPLLALDDLGVEKPTEWATERLNAIVDYRDINGLPLVVTMNVSMNMISPRVASRLQRHINGRVVVLKGKEYRLEKAINMKGESQR